MSVYATGDLEDEGRRLVIVALVGAELRIRIFDAGGAKVVDKAESEFVGGELAALKQLLSAFPEEARLSKQHKQKIMDTVTSIAGHTLGGKVVPVPILGGLHHDYQWAA